MGNKTSSNVQAYLDFNSKTIRFVESFKHDPKNEAEFVSTNDERMRSGDECYLVSTEWLKAWIGYTNAKDKPIGPISNQCLVEYEGESLKLKKEACLGRDFAPVCKAIWEYYFMAYGGGPVLAFIVPPGQSKKTYKTGKWLEIEEFRNECRIICPDSTGVRSLAYVSVSDVSLEQNSSAQEHAVAAARNMPGDTGKSKLLTGQSMQKEIDAAVLESVGLIIYNRKGLGKKMIHHANVVMEQCREDGDGSIDQNNMVAIRHMLEEGLALILQHAWRIRRARRRAKELKRKQRRLLVLGAISLIQSRWRIRQTRVKALAARQDTAALIIQRTIRRFMARCRLEHIKKSSQPLTYVLAFKGVHDFRVKVHDPYLVMSVYNLESRRSTLTSQSSDLQPGLVSGAKKVRRGSVIASPEKHEKMVLKCFNKSKISGQESFLCADWNSQLVLSLFDASTLGSRDKCLGQKVIELRDHPSVFKGEVVEFSEVSVDKYRVAVQDPLSNDLVPVGAEPEEASWGSGKISFSLRLCDMSRSMCGWVMRASQSLLTKGQLKRRWMILVDDTMYCYEDPFALDACSGSLRLEKAGSVVHILIASASGTPGMRVHVKNESWTITWDPEEHPYIRRMWARKFIRALPETVYDKLEPIEILQG